MYVYMALKNMWHPPECKYHVLHMRNKKHREYLNRELPLNIALQAFADIG